MSDLGFGLGLRPRHYEAILKSTPRVDWFEALSENYMIPGGRPLHYLMRIRERYPVVLHGVSLSIGSTDPLDRAYLRRLKALAARVEPEWISDHLCWTGVAGRNLHDLMPLPYTEEALRHVARRVRAVRDFLGRRLLIENVSSYVAYRDSSMTEWEFLAALAREADCDAALRARPASWLVWRKGHEPFYRALSPAEAGRADRGTARAKLARRRIDLRDRDTPVMTGPRERTAARSAGWRA